ncbi:hypothetical protein BDV96DRAFT_570419 [Lophiotrema nucula]|uniref:N-acetyltransferase domain-containing protein n=1 Tax=Lophiotrema nucula TaxID=690887 RepID=A0A6A5ZDH7_9PLEO|nr:hypothetical protein BDV96DRAFT_570419 [Lophiotrema nucula]
MIIQEEDLTAPDVIALVTDHMNDMRTSSESYHVLDLIALQLPSMTFYTTRTEDGELQGCCALKELSPEHGEIKSMRTASAHFRKGIARQMTTILIGEAKNRSMKRLSLETGAAEKWAPQGRCMRFVDLRWVSRMVSTGRTKGVYL